MSVFVVTLERMGGFCHTENRKGTLTAYRNTLCSLRRNMQWLTV